MLKPDRLQKRGLPLVLALSLLALGAGQPPADTTVNYPLYLPFVSRVLSADLSVTIDDGAAYRAPGAATSYQVRATNSGPAGGVRAARLSAAFPAQLNNPAWTCTASAGSACGALNGVGNISTSLDLALNGQVTFTVSANISPAASGQLTVGAAITSPVEFLDPAPANNQALDQTVVVSAADLSVTLTSARTRIGPGGFVSYTLTASNAGPLPATGASLSASLPLTGTNWTCLASGGATCGAPSGANNPNLSVNLPVAGQVRLTISGTASFNAFGTLSASAVVSPAAGLPELQAGDNSASLSLPVLTRPSESAGWLAYLNYQRTLGGLPALVENASWSDGAQKHSRYMVKNDQIAYGEVQGYPYYTPEGNFVGPASNLLASNAANVSDKEALDVWLKGPFHAIGMLDAQLLSTGFGSYHEADGGYQSAATLDIIHGLGSLPAGVTFPLMWPGDGLATNLLTFDNRDVPSPLTSCGYELLTTGLPLIVQIGSGGVTPAVTASSFQRSDGQNAEYCLFDETNYANPDSSQQTLGRDLLNRRDAIVLIPKLPLQAGQRYTVSITVNGQKYTWTFQTTLDAN